MASRTVQYAAIFLTCFIDILGFGIVIPVLPLYAEHFGATAVQVGWLVGTFSLMQFFFSPIWGKVSDRVGRRPVLLAGLAGTVGGFVLMGWAGTVFWLFVARIVAGVSGANIGAAQAYLADISTPENRAKAMGLMGAAFGLGFVFGPALGGWASVQFRSFAAPMYVAAGLAAANFLFVLFFLPESRRREAGPAPRMFPELFSHVEKRTFFWCLGGYFLVIAGFSMMTAMYALTLAHRFGWDALRTGYVLAGVGMIGVFIQGGMIGKLVRRVGEARLALAGAALMAAGLAGLALGVTPLAVIGATVVVGIGNSLLMPTLSALASRSAEPAWQGRALSVMQSGGSLARFGGPMTAGFLLDAQLRHGSGLYASVPLAVSAVLVALAAGAITALCQKVG